MPQQANLRRSLSDRHYKWLSISKCKELGLMPHTARYDRESRRLIVYCQKSPNGDDYSINDEALRTVIELQDDDRIAVGYFAQVNPERDSEIIAWETAKNISVRLNGCEPREGRFGDYYFVKARSFRPTGRRLEGEIWEDDEIDF